jgi:hypothetical protein
MEALSWRPELGSRILVVVQGNGRHGGVDSSRVVLLPARESMVTTAETRSSWMSSNTNGPLYEEYGDLPNLFSSVGPGRPTRLVIDIAAIVDSRTHPCRYTCAPDFPRHRSGF